MSLTQELNEAVEGFRKNAPAEVQDIMLKAHEELIASNVAKHAKRTGDTFLDFNLLDSKGDKVTLDNVLDSNRFLVISFYRGGWCPYCNLELKSLESKKSEIEALGAKLVAITPELASSVDETTRKNNTSFTVLTDERSEFSSKMGLAFSLPEALKPIYSNFGINVQKHNGEGEFSLPVPATYIIDKEKRIIFYFVDVDYTKRLDPEEIITALKNA